MQEVSLVAWRKFPTLTDPAQFPRWGCVIARYEILKFRRTHARDFALFMIGNARGIAEVIMNGVCEKFPRLDFVSIESGFGFLPYFLQALDWQWHNDGIGLDNPGVPVPSEMFKRQVYGTFWFEQIVPEHVAPWVDNLMFETDYPHPTCLYPDAVDYMTSAVAEMTPEERGKVFGANAARIYALPGA